MWLVVSGLWFWQSRRLELCVSLAPLVKNGNFSRNVSQSCSRVSPLLAGISTLCVSLAPVREL